MRTNKNNYFLISKVDCLHYLEVKFHIVKQIKIKVHLKTIFPTKYLQAQIKDNHFIFKTKQVARQLEGKLL